MLALLVSRLRLLVSSPELRDVTLENLALRQQLAVFKRKCPRPLLRAMDRFFWVWLLRSWKDWQRALIIVRPETVVAWHRKGFRLFWTWISSVRADGQRSVLRFDRLILKMAAANPLWGAPRIHGELLKLRYRHLGTNRVLTPSQKASTTLPNLEGVPRQSHQRIGLHRFLHGAHRDVSGLFVLVVVAHRRRIVIHFNVTEHPTAAGTAQQILEAFPDDTAPRYLIRDRDQTYGECFRNRIRDLGITEVLTAPQSPWQNPFAERLVGSIRRECLDHVIVLGEEHLRRILRGYFHCYQSSRTHLSLAKDTPTSRVVQGPEAGEIMAIPQVGGLHHRYERHAT